MKKLDLSYYKNTKFICYIDILSIFMFSLVKFRLPYRKKGYFKLSNESLPRSLIKCDQSKLDPIIIKYDVITCKNIDIEKHFLSKDLDLVYHMIYLTLSGKSSITLDAYELMMENILSFSGEIFFKTFKLQRYSEYKSEQRNSIINNILK